MIRVSRWQMFIPSSPTPQHIPYYRRQQHDKELQSLTPLMLWTQQIRFILWHNNVWFCRGRLYNKIRNYTTGVIQAGGDVWRLTYVWYLHNVLREVGPNLLITVRHVCGKLKIGSADRKSDYRRLTAMGCVAQSCLPRTLPRCIVNRFVSKADRLDFHTGKRDTKNKKSDCNIIPRKKSLHNI